MTDEVKCWSIPLIHSLRFIGKVFAEFRMQTRTHTHSTTSKTNNRPKFFYYYFCTFSCNCRRTNRSSNWDLLSFLIAQIWSVCPVPLRTSNSHGLCFATRRPDIPRSTCFFCCFICMKFHRHFAKFHFRFIFFALKWNFLPLSATETYSRRRCLRRRHRLRLRHVIQY